MGIFGKIMSAIFTGSAQAQPGGVAQPRGGVAPGTAGAGSPNTSSPPIAPAGGSPMANVDVGMTLDNLAKEKKQKLDWKHSIVDLMKLLDLDSSLSARKELARELNYSGDMNDSATMNIWLHKQVMAKLAANGGKLPADLKD
ncbi:MAG TPA: DUF3597 domain-containing protein [Xanthobacteraceae bacterium]|nr:DUF3597 domain-containing protein [Xanthobacteraceae bacterium]